MSTIPSKLGVRILNFRTYICIIFINLFYIFFMSGINIFQRIQSLAQDCKCSICRFLTQFLFFQILHLICYIVGAFRSLWSERISNSNEHIKRNLSDSSIQPNLLIDNNNNWIHLLGDYNSQPVNLLKDNNNNWCQRISQLS